MKAHINFSKNQFKPLSECIGCCFLSLQSWLAGFKLLKRVEQMKHSARRILSNLKSERFSNLMTLRALAAQVGVVHNSKAVVKAFPRFVIGLGLLVWAAPYADIFYTRLDFNDRVSPEVWYYESFHWLFLCLGPYLKSILQTIGMYLVFARGSGILSLVAGYALMYDMGKVMWLLQVSSHDEYKALPTSWFSVYGFIAAIFIILILDKLTFWLNHRVGAIKSRLHGLRNIADKVDAETLKHSFVQTMDADVKVQQFKA